MTDEITNKTKTHFHMEENFLNSKMILLNILQNFAIISILHEKSDFLRLHNFTKCFSGTIVNQVVHKCLNG